MNYKIIHTCIRVNDLEKSLEFYKGALGLMETGRKVYPEDFTLVFLSDEEGTIEIELTWNYGRTEPYVIGNGFSHMAFSVENLEESHRIHNEMGLEITELMGLPGDPPRYYFITDPDGYDVEIVRE
jgi:lactoylglutathione lyase